MKGKFFGYIFLCLGIFFLQEIWTSCSFRKNDTVIIWTNRREFVSYAELFNATNEDVKVLVVYKERPAESLPPAKDETPPDIVIGPWLTSNSVRKNFRPVDYLFSEQQINQSAFYPKLLNTGNINDKQYLLPVSFNLPAVIFSEQNNSYVEENYMLTIDQIRDKASTFNKTNKDGSYSKMGFAPSWNSDFLYLVAKIQGASFSEQGELFSWNQAKMDSTVEYLCSWTETFNSATSVEQDFAFKYLYTPEYKQVATEKCLFAYTNSQELFSIPKEQLQNIDFRWIHQDLKILVEDDMIFLGLHKQSKNSAGAEAFITWFMQEETQGKLLDRTTSMGLNVESFGISGGFSAIRNVNERIFPLYYEHLQGNIPPAEYIDVVNILPIRWESLKSRIVLPWLESYSDTKQEEVTATMEVLIDTWSKQFE